MASAERDGGSVAREAVAAGTQALPVRGLPGASHAAQAGPAQRKGGTVAEQQKPNTTSARCG